MEINIYQKFDNTETNTETYTYEAASYFGTGEGEFKTQYNNHKKLLAPL